MNRIRALLVAAWDVFMTALLALVIVAAPFLVLAAVVFVARCAWETGARIGGGA